MRTPNSRTGRGLRLGVGLALAGSALAIAPLAPALAQTTQLLPPDDRAVDLYITLKSDAKSYAVGDTALWGFVGKAQNNAKSRYGLFVKLPAGLEVVGTPSRPGFDCEVTDDKRLVSCDNYQHDEVQGAQPFTMNVKATKTGKFTATASISRGNEPDAWPADNDTTETVTITKRKSASVKGVVWKDANANGRRDKSEKGLAGAKVLLFIRQAVTPIMTTTTNKSGAYLFTLDMTNSGGNWHTIIVGSPDKKLMPAEPDRGDDARDSDLSASNGTAAQREHFDGLPTAGASVQLKAGVNAVVDGGFSSSPTVGDIRGRIWNDVDQDGVMDAGEPGVAGVTVVLSGHTAGSGGIQAMKTDSDGRYLFTDRPVAGMGDLYSLYVAEPKGWKWARKQHAFPEDLGDGIPAAIREALGTDTKVLWTFTAPTHDTSNAMIAGLVKASGEDTLPTTGASVEGIAASGGALLLSGLGLALAARRRRTA